MSDSIEIGKRIRAMREKSGLTQEELGISLGLNKSTVQRYESGKISRIKLPILEAIASELGINPEYLTLTTDDPTDYENDEDYVNAPLDVCEYLGDPKKIVKFQRAVAEDAARDSARLHIVPPPSAMERLPVIGEVAAGYQCLADMRVIDYVPCDASLLRAGYEYVYLKVRGDSMEPELHEGDLVLVQVQDTVESGEYAVVLVDEEDGLVKKIEIDSTHISLISENPYYPPRRFDREEMNRVRIFGKVIGMNRRF